MRYSGRPREFLWIQRRDAEAFTLVTRAEAWAVVVDDVVEREKTRPVDVFDAMDHDEGEGKCNENKPQEEVVEEGIVYKGE